MIRACAEADREDEDGGTWIDAEIMESYCALHRAGLAHSVETWQGGRLAGGLYGVALGGAFFGESMFHHVTDASKVGARRAGRSAAQRAATRCSTSSGSRRISTQFGAIEIPRRDATCELLEEALAIGSDFG